MSRPRRSPLPRRAGARGFVLIALLVLLTMGGLYFLVSNLTPEAIEARRQAKTDAALVQARDALIGYALQYREQQIATDTLDAMYGFLPMPDVGTSRFHASQTPACNTEGCAMSFVNGAFPSTTETVVGRLPWRTLGTGPLLDGYGECLWYIVSANFKSLGMDANAAMNWDTLGQIDIVTTNDTANLQSLIANAHDRPVAIIFSPGPLLGSQVRGQTGSDVVTECGGNYNPANYLEPSLAAAILDNDTDLASAYFTGAIPNSTSTYFTGAIPTDTSPTSLLAISTQGKIVTDGTNLKKACASGTNCSLVANDIGLTITSDLLFGAIRKSAYFRTDINAMLERMSTCLRDQIQANIDSPLNPPVSPVALTGFMAPAGKEVGRIPSNTCYNDAQNPLGYFTHYQDQVFLLKPTSGSLSVSVDGGSAGSCTAALVFAGQRGTKSPAPSDTSESTTQLRTAAAVSTTNSILNTNWPANYLEGDNLITFTTSEAITLTGNKMLGQVRASKSDIARCAPSGPWKLEEATCHVAEQDIVRCIPSGASLTVVAPTVAATTGAIQLASYAPSTRTLTLGSGAINSNYGASAAALFACAWTPEAHASGTGFRSYFRFRIQRVGEGFAYAVIDGDRNDSDACGAARQHLGYSGNNGITPYVQWPKLAIEFDTMRNRNFSEPATLSNGRNDPCYLSSCGSTQNLASNAHVAVVYWGYGATDGTIPVTQPQEDDNVHGFPWPPDSSTRPAPRNPYPIMPYPTPAPEPAPGVAPLDRMGATSPAATASAKREFHARVEVTRSFTTPVDAKDGATGMQVQVWIEPHAAANISAMTYNAGSPPTLTVTAASHGLETGTVQNPTYVVIKDAVPSGYNGEYVIAKIDANNFTATLPAGTANPGPYISAMTWNSRSSDSPPLPSQCSDNDWDCVTVNSANHGLSTGDSISINGAIPTEFNTMNPVTHIDTPRTITRIDANSYWFRLSLSYQPGPLPPAVAAARALTPRAIALANTTRPMSQLDSTFKPLVSDTATIYDEQMSACAASAPFCPSGSCGSDNMCYRPSFRNLRLGFTIGERVTNSTSTAREQLIDIRDQAITWLPTSGR